MGCGRNPVPLWGNFLVFPFLLSSVLLRIQGWLGGNYEIILSLSLICLLTHGHLEGDHGGPAHVVGAGVSGGKKLERPGVRMPDAASGWKRWPAMLDIAQFLDPEFCPPGRPGDSNLLWEKAVSNVGVSGTPRTRLEAAPL